MKKTFMLIAFAVITLTFTSCKSEPKTETTTETTTAETEVAYICPMDCEKGKTYTEPGKCPVCEMDLVVSSDATMDSHEGHDHDDHEGHSH